MSPMSSMSERSPIPDSGLRVLAVDDEVPALEDLIYELSKHERIGTIERATNANEALVAFRGMQFDAVFLDVNMPGLSGLDLARVLNQFRDPPAIVFVTAFENHAVDAFEISAVDYLLKPVRTERVAESIRRIMERLTQAAEPTRTMVASSQGTEPGLSEMVDIAGGSANAVTTDVDSAASGTASAPSQTPQPPATNHDDALLSVESGGRVRFVHRDDVHYVAASGDYVRLHLASGSVLLRASISSLQEKWISEGFIRIHRSYLVGIAHITEVRIEPTRGYVVVVGGALLPVSRRLGRSLRERLMDEARKAHRERQAKAYE